MDRGLWQRSARQLARPRVVGLTGVMLVAFSVAPSGRPAVADTAPQPEPGSHPDTGLRPNTDQRLDTGSHPDTGQRPGADDASVHDAVAEAVAIVRASGLPHRTDAMFTTIEGDWDECMAVVKDCCDAVQSYGSRVSLVLKADIRPGFTGELTGKLDRLEEAIQKR